MTETATDRLDELLDRNVLLALPAVLLFSLLVLPFMTRYEAGLALTRISMMVLVVLAVIDLLTQKVPNLVIYPAIGFVLVGVPIVDSSLLDDVVLGGLVLFAVMFFPALVSRRAMGMGDVKFACFIGCVLGWRVGLFALASGFAVGAVVVGLLLLARQLTLKQMVPLTPFLALGAVIWIVGTGSLFSSSLGF